MSRPSCGTQSMCWTTGFAVEHVGQLGQQPHQRRERGDAADEEPASTEARASGEQHGAEHAMQDQQNDQGLPSIEATGSRPMAPAPTAARNGAEYSQSGRRMNAASLERAGAIGRANCAQRVTKPSRFGVRRAAPTPAGSRLRGA